MKTLYVYTKTPGRDFLDGKFPEKDPNATGTISADYNTLDAMRNVAVNRENSQPRGFELPNVHTIYSIEVSDEKARAFENVMRPELGCKPLARGVKVSEYPIVDADTIISSDYFRGTKSFSEATRQDIFTHKRGLDEMMQREAPLQFLQKAQKRTASMFLARVDVNSQAMIKSAHECFHPNGLCLQSAPVYMKPLQDAMKYIACNGDLDAISRVSDFREKYVEKVAELADKNGEVAINAASIKALRDVATQFAKDASPNMQAQNVFGAVATMANQKIPEAISMDSAAHAYYFDMTTQYLQSYGNYMTQEMKQHFTQTVLANIHKDALSTFEPTNEIQTLSIIKSTAQEWASAYQKDGNYKVAFCCNNIANAAQDAIDSHQSYTQEADNREGLDELEDVIE